MFRIWPLYTPLPSTAMLLADISHSMPKLPEWTQSSYIIPTKNHWHPLCHNFIQWTYEIPLLSMWILRSFYISMSYDHWIQATPNDPDSNPCAPTKSMVDLTSPLEILHIISPELEALPIPSWFLDYLSEDLPPNPPNSPVHFPTKILHPTTTGTPQYLDIWFMSSKSSQYHCIIPPASSSPGEKHTPIVTDITLYDPLYSCQLHCDEDILEELNTPDYPWDALHHCALFFP